MTLDEAIKHAEEVAEEQEKAAKEWHENQVRKCKLIPFAEMDYTHENECEECAVEHRRLAEWLKELKQLREQQSVLDKIRAEIRGIIEEYDARCERFHYKPYKPTKGFPENGVAPRNPIEIESRKWGERAEGLERALKIIDKHVSGKESEEQT